MPRKISIKIPPGQAKKLGDAVDLVRGHYGPLFEVWPELSPEKRQRVLAGSPLLARLLQGIVALLLVAVPLSGATISSNGTGGGLWSATGTWSGGVLPADGEGVTIAAGDTVTMDFDSSAYTGYLTVTITGAAVTPATLRWMDGYSGYLKVRTGYNIVGTSAATYGRLLANSTGTWGETAALPADHKAVVLLEGTATLYATYLAIDLRCTHPTNWYVQTYGTAYTCTNQATDVNTSTDVVTFTAAPPAASTPVRVVSSVTLPTGLAAGRIYYVKSVSGNTCKLALQDTDIAVVDITATGSGTLTMYSGHTDTGTKTLNVVQDVTGDVPWTTTSGHNRVALVDVAPEAYDQQRDTLATINAATLVLTTNNVDSAQFPLARLYLVSRNVSIRSSGTTTAQAVVSFTAGSPAAVLDCEIVNTGGTGTTFYGYGILNGTGQTIPGVVSGCSRGVSAASSIVLSGAAVANGTGVRQITGTVSGEVAGCTNGVDSSTGPTISGTVVGCTNGVTGDTLDVVSGTLLGNQYGINGGKSGTISADISGCYYAVYNCTAMALTGPMSGCTYGVGTCRLTLVAGAMQACDTGVTSGTSNILAAVITQATTAVSAGTGTLAGATLSGNTTDIYLNNGAYSGWGATLGSGTHVSSYLYSSVNIGYPGCVSIQDLGGAAEAIGTWSGGGYIQTEVWVEGTHDPSGEISPNPTQIHALHAQDNRADVWVATPFRAVASNTVTITARGRLTASALWTDRPVFAIVDPTQPWKGANELLDSETQANDTSWHTYVLTYSPTRDRELCFLVRAKGGNTSGTGTEQCYFDYEIDTETGGGTRAYGGVQ